MKVLPASTITSVAASSENANYPANNILDEHPKKLWKGTGANETLTFEIGEGANSFYLFNTNATGATFYISDPNFVDWVSDVEWVSDIEWAINDNFIAVAEINGLNGSDGGVMVTFEKQTSIIQLVVSLTNENGDILQAGVAVAGESFEYPGPAIDNLSEGFIDYSYVDELSNGAVFVKNRDLVREFDVASIMTKTLFDSFITNVIRIVKSNPAAWFISTDDDPRWLVYARFRRLPDGIHSIPGYTQVKFKLTEVI